MSHQSVVLEQQRLAELKSWAVSAGASGWIIDVEPYEACRVAGIVELLRIDPSQGTIEVTITDGTERLLARWSIRRPTPELAAVPGRGVLLQGVARAAESGLVMLEPTISILPESAEA